MKRNLIVGVAAAVMSCGAMVADDAGPDYWDLQFVSIEGARVSAAWDVNGDTGTYSGTAGRITMRSLDNQGLFAAGTEFNSFCSDVGIRLARDWDYTPVNPVPATETGVRPAWRDGGFLAAATLAVNASALGANTAAEFAGIQLAIWEALYDADFDLATGGFKVLTADASVLDAANTYLAALAGLTPVTDATWIMPIDNVVTEDQTYVVGGSQGLITHPQVPDGGVTLLLLALGFGGLSLLQRRGSKV